MVVSIVRCCCQGWSRVHIQKNGIYIIRHCIQGPYQGPLHIPQKEILPDLTKKVKKNKIQMISSIRVHPMGCWEGGHMTNCLKWFLKK